MAKNEKKQKDKDYGGLFIPGGLILGMGVGFLVNNVSAGMFIGLGMGFILFAISGLVKK